MNSVHDMGGMHGFGPVLPERDEPAFHADWERRIFGLTLAAAVSGQWNLDMSRFARESLPPALYLSSSYYEIWYAALEKLLVEHGLVSAEELADGVPRVPALAARRCLEAASVAATLARGGPADREASTPARFGVGDCVRTRLINPTTHTRLPRYARGRPGRIERVHGVHVFPDSNARGQGEQPQWLYGVRFEAADLWGADTTASSVRVDCWESYLEPR